MNIPLPIYDRQYPYLCNDFPVLFRNAYKKVIQHYFPEESVYSRNSLSNLMYYILLRKIGKSRYSRTDPTIYYHSSKSADTIRGILYPQLLEGRRVTAPRLIRLIDAETYKIASTLSRQYLP